MVKFADGRRGPLILCGLPAVLCLAAVALWWPGYVERVVAPGQIQAIDGHAYYVGPLDLTAPWLFRVQSDTFDLPNTSNLALHEDATALGKPHTTHAEIGALGRGGYSHWGDGLFFSSSDNSDPRTNGRRYVMRASLVPRKRLIWILAAGVVLGLFGFLRAIGSRFATLAGWQTLLWQGLRADGLPAIIRAVCVSAVAGVVVYLGYAWLIDPLAALELARKASVKLAMAGTWVAIGAVTAVWLRRRDLKSWRLALALVALAGTGCFLFLRTEVYAGNQLLPSFASIAGPMLAGAIGAYLAQLDFFRRRFAEFWAVPGAGRRWLAATIGLVLLLAAPMILSPVVQNWNASGWMDSHGYDTYAHNIISGKIPEGSSQYMPVYQYGMAAVYYVFGHFFFTQQLINVLFAFLMVTLICLSAWNLFRNYWAVLLIGVWAAFSRQMFYAVFFTQIESWYMPIVAFGIFAWTSYWRSPSTTHLVLIALAAGVGINTRNQGAFYFGWLCLAPFFITVLPWRRRFTHAAIAVAILAASLLPWSLRNYAVDGRLSPSSARNAIYVAILNDPRIGFYGVRYWEGWGEITEDYKRRYPDPVERDSAMMSAGLRTPFEHFDWFKRAMFWRTLGFYGLLPPGIFATEGPTTTDWPNEWRGFVYWRTTPLLLLPLSLLGLLTRPSRATLFLAGAVLANVVVTTLTGGAEDRVSYPVLPMHMLMALAAIFPLFGGQPGWGVAREMFGLARKRTWMVAAACLLVLVVLARQHFGRPNLYAPQVERAVFVNPKVALDPSLPSLNDFAATSLPSPPPTPDWEGRTVRLRLMVLNYQCPPKFGGRVGYVPEFATEPKGPTYYYAALLVRRADSVEHVRIGVSWSGATLNEELREGDEVEAEGGLMLAAENPIATYWVRIEKARKVAVRSSEIPAFN